MIVDWGGTSGDEGWTWTWDSILLLSIAEMLQSPLTFIGEGRQRPFPLTSGMSILSYFCQILWEPFPSNEWLFYFNSFNQVLVQYLPVYFLSIDFSFFFWNSPDVYCEGCITCLLPYVHQEENSCRQDVLSHTRENGNKIKESFPNNNWWWWRLSCCQYEVLDIPTDQIVKKRPLSSGGLK